MAVKFKDFDPADVSLEKLYVETLNDVTQETISGSVTRKKFNLFTTGSGGGPEVTSGFFETIYDQNFTLQQANAVFDMTIGLASASTTVQNAVQEIDASGKMLFASSTLMMNEKVDIYRQYSQTLLGNSNLEFSLPFDSNTDTDKIGNALFLSIKRLFAKDGIKPATTTIRFYQSASLALTTPNLPVTSELGIHTYHDLADLNNTLLSPGGRVVPLKDATDSNRIVGLSFIDQGTIVLDLEKVLSGAQFASGTIDAANTDGFTVLGGVGTETATTSKFIPDFMVSASIDNIVDHIASARFSSGSLSAMTFTNKTSINSSLYFIRARYNEFNYSSNPTYINPITGHINTIELGEEQTQRASTMITKIGLYSPDNVLLAVAVLSRPIHKSTNDELVFRVRLDY